MRNDTPSTRTTMTPPQTLTPYLGQPFPTADLILLCGFGSDLAGERTAKALHHLMVESGFPASMTRHLIRTSPLLRRTSRGCYRLSDFQG